MKNIKNQGAVETRRTETSLVMSILRDSRTLLTEKPMIVLFAILFGLSLAGLIACYCCCDSIRPTAICGLLTCSFWVAFLVSITKDDEKKPKEFPANKYTLELKVTEFQGQVDTTYVLIPKSL